MRRWVLSLVLTAFLSQQPSGAALSRRPTRSAPCLVDADCLAFQECVWDREDPKAQPTGICLAKKFLIRRAALKQGSTNSQPAPRSRHTTIAEVRAKTASKRVKHDTSAYLPSAFGESNEPTRFYNQNYGRTRGGASENAFNPNQGSQQYQGYSPLSGRDRSGGWKQETEWPTVAGQERGVQNTVPKQARPGIIILPSLGQNHGKWQPNFVSNNVAGKVSTHANPPTTYGTASSQENLRKPTRYISGPITSSDQQMSKFHPKGKFTTTDNRGVAPSSDNTEERTSNGGDDWRSHVATFREDSTGEEIVLDNSKDVNFIEPVPKHAESSKEHSSSQGEVSEGRFHGMSSHEDREKEEKHQTRRQDVLRLQEQNSKLHDSVLESPREVHVKQHPKKQTSHIPTGDHAVFDPILEEPTGLENDVDEVDVVKRREQTTETDKDYF
ncbi:PREDICTED: uncharacterized protein LOC109468351 [Branchiostoma belcheri]|uniref:Uncharacterized protein LOC109468351 n=1 Tax=Branchiostoma belcheri TaxID=7741 RepID=A0A6P4YK88_BRABE|nr:PREDICTED: uncharacterized protein LOC109468351 [Branchiostoma belcheri]